MKLKPGLGALHVIEPVSAEAHTGPLTLQCLSHESANKQRQVDISPVVVRLLYLWALITVTVADIVATRWCITTNDNGKMPSDEKRNIWRKLWPTSQNYSYVYLTFFKHTSDVV